MPRKSIDVVDKVVQRHKAKAIVADVWGPEAWEASAAARAASKGKSKSSLTPEQLKTGRLSGVPFSQRSRPIGSATNSQIAQALENKALLSGNQEKALANYEQSARSGTKWDVSGKLKGMPDQMTGTMEELEHQIKQSYPNHNLEFEGYTDQLDVYHRHDSGRRSRFMTLMASDAVDECVHRAMQRHAHGLAMKNFRRTIVADVWGPEAWEASAAARVASKKGKSSSKPQRSSAPPTSTPAHNVLIQMGFDHKPGAGSNAQRDPYQYYRHQTATGAPLNDIQHTMMQQGFHQTMPVRSVMGAGTGRTMHATSFSRTAPYHEESISFSSESGGQNFQRATHYNGSASHDHAITKLLRKREAQQIVKDIN